MARTVHLTRAYGDAVRFSKGQGEALRISTSGGGDPVHPSSSGKIVWVTNPEALPVNLRPGTGRDELKP